MKPERADYIRSKPHIIFDFDETIATMITDWVQWHDRMVEAVAPMPSHDLYPHDYSHEAQNTFIKAITYEEREILAKANAAAEEALTSELIPHQAVIDFIRSCTHNTLYIWSSNGRATVERNLQALSLRDAFDHIVSFDDVVYLKPEADGFAVIHAIAQAPLEDYIFIGNSMRADEPAARKAGIEFVHVDEFGTS